MKKYLLAGGLSLGLIGAAVAGGLYTNNLPQVSPPTVNGSAVCSVTGAAGGTGGTICSTSVPVLPQLTPYATPSRLTAYFQSGQNQIPVDTGLTQGAAPQTVAASPFEVAALYASIAGNTSSAAVGGSAAATTCAGTINAEGGVATCTGAATSAGGTFTLTITDSAINTSSIVQIEAFLGTATTGGLTPVSVTAAAGSFVAVFSNNTTAALNGTVVFPFHI